MRRRVGPVRAAFINAANQARTEMAQTGDAGRKTLLAIEARAYEVADKVVETLTEAQEGSLELTVKTPLGELPFALKARWDIKDDGVADADG